MPTPRDRVQEGGGTPGTGNVTLSGATAGYVSFASAMPVGTRIEYCIEAVSPGLWEVGIGTLIASTTLQRDLVLSNSSGTLNKINFGASVNIFVTLSADSARVGGMGRAIALSIGHRGGF